MSDQEVRQLAEDMFKGLIFTDRNVQIKEGIPKVFVPLMLMGKEFINELQEIPVGMIYEYMDKAGPRSINGMPIFMSFKFIDVKDQKKVIEIYNKIREVVANV